MSASILKQRMYRTIFLLLLGMLMVSGCKEKSAVDPELFIRTKTEEFQAQVRKVVKDPARAEQAVAVAGQMTEPLIKAYRQQLAIDQELRSLFASYESSKDDYQKLFAANEEARLASHQIVLALSARLGALTTEKEWKKLEGARGKAFVGYVKSMGGRL